jgi:predicted nuclease with TOPRIM domain
MALTPEAWTVIGTGVVILIAIAASNRQLRSEMNGLRGEMKEIHGEIGRLRERMAKLEGLLESLREAITGRKAA